MTAGSAGFARAREPRRISAAVLVRAWWFRLPGVGASGVGVLRVDVAGLGVMAARYEVSAAEVAGAAPAVGAGGSGQPSAAAVGAVRAGVVVVGAVLSARAADSGAKVVAADECYVKSEAESAARLGTWV